MKILVQGTKNNHVAAFQQLVEQRGHQWIWWEESHTPAFDVFYEVKPRLYIGTGIQSVAVQKCLRKTNVPSLIEISPPFNYVLQTDYEQLPNIIGAGVSFNVLVNDNIFKQEDPDPRFICDVAYCGPINHTLMELCYPVGKYHVKIAGEFRWPVVQYIGAINVLQRAKLYNAARLVYADTVEEAIKAIACGTPVLSSEYNVIASFPHHTQLAQAFDGQFQLEKFDGKEYIKENTYTYAFTHIAELCNQSGVQI